MRRIPSKTILLCAAVIQTQLQTTPAYLTPLKEPKHLRLDVSTSNSVAKPTQQLQDLHKSPSEGEKTWSGNLQRDRVQLQDSSSSADKTADIVTAAVDIFSLSRLPTPEPTIFYALILWKVWTQKESFYKYVEFECPGYRSPEEECCCWQWLTFRQPVQLTHLQSHMYSDLYHVSWWYTLVIDLIGQ